VAVLPLKKGRGVVHSFNCSLRMAGVRFADALVDISVCVTGMHFGIRYEYPLLP